MNFFLVVLEEYLGMLWFEEVMNKGANRKQNKENED